MAQLSQDYWRLSRAPRYSLLFALPLLVLYEAAAFALSGDAIAGVRNGADVLLKSLFLSLGGHRGLLVFDVLLLAIGATLIIRDLRRSRGRLQPGIFLGMSAEAVVGGLVFGVVAGTLTALLLGQTALLGKGALLAQGAGMSLDLPTRLVVSLGAGIYEELLFRVVLVGAFAWAGRKLLGWSPTASGVTAAVLGALIFSAFHYIGPYGDPFETGSFVFRAVAGLLFSGMYLLRGLGITAWTHALYDVFLNLSVPV